jgi:predicted dithiol-disulfide oxidoreductase (DUF899 family)
VYGAGVEKANGIYTSVDSTPSGEDNQGPLIWRHEEHEWLHILNNYDKWWIGHHEDMIENLYSTEGASDE